MINTLRFIDFFYRFFFYYYYYFLKCVLKRFVGVRMHVSVFVKMMGRTGSFVVKRNRMIVRY